jgi:hypothetical protein
MRFFSSDRNESNDDQSNVDVQNRAEEVNPDQAHDEHPERVSSDPIPVPQQRTGSPWADAPGTPADESADAELADTERADGTEEPPPFHEPSPQPTAFGASTVGGAVAASAMANPQNDRWDVTDRDTDAASGVADDRSVAPGDGAVTDEASPWATGPDGGTAERTDRGDRPAGFGEERGDHVDAALEDRGTFDDPHVRDELADTGGPDPTPPDAAVETGTMTTFQPDGTMTTTDQTDRTEPGVDTDRVEGEPALRDEGTFEDPTAVDPATRQPLDTGRDTVEDRDGATGSVAAGAAAGAAAGTMAADRSTRTDIRDLDAMDTTGPAETSAPATDAGTGGHHAASMPGSVVAPDLGSLFGASDSQTFHERWREVQLRFVDSPKDATSDAAALLDEAVEKLSANLRAQKDSLKQDSDDTEQLRVQLRGYRDMINRILDL